MGVLWELAIKRLCETVLPGSLRIRNLPRTLLNPKLTSDGLPPPTLHIGSAAGDGEHLGEYLIPHIHVPRRDPLIHRILNPLRDPPGVVLPDSDLAPSFAKLGALHLPGFVVEFFCFILVCP